MKRRTKTSCENVKRGALYLECNYKPTSEWPCSVHRAIVMLEPAKIKNFVDYMKSTGRDCHYDVLTGIHRAGPIKDTR